MSGAWDRAGAGPKHPPANSCNIVVNVDIAKHTNITFIFEGELWFWGLSISREKPLGKASGACCFLHPQHICVVSLVYPLGQPKHRESLLKR